MTEFSSDSANNLLTLVSWLLIASIVISFAAMCIQVARQSKTQEATKIELFKQYNCLITTGCMIFVFHFGWLILDFDVTEAWIWLLTIVEFQLIFIILSQPQDPKKTYKHFTTNELDMNINMSTNKRAFIMAKLRVFVYVGIVSVSFFYWYFVMIVISFLPYLSNDFEIIYNSDEAQKSSGMENVFYLNSLCSFYSLIDNFVNFKWKSKRLIACNIFLFFSWIINLYASYSVQFAAAFMFHVLIFVSFIFIVIGTFWGWFQDRSDDNKNDKLVWKRASATVIGASGVGKTRFLRGLISQRYVFLFLFYLLVL